MRHSLQAQTSSQLRVVVSQRVVEKSVRGERRDALDQAWAILLSSINAVCVPVPNSVNNVLAFLEAVAPNAVVLSGGGNLSSEMRRRDGGFALVPRNLRDTAPERDATERILLTEAENHGWPVLGVCRGMQALVAYHGGTIAALKGHSGTRHLIDDSVAGSTRGLRAEREVNSFHDFGVMPDGLPGIMYATDHAPDGSIEAVGHRTLPHFGVMWHPERERPQSAADLDRVNRILRFGSLE